MCWIADDEEYYVLDTCVVIDFCGRTNNLSLLMSHLGDRAVITTAVLEELERNRRKRYSLLTQFLELVEQGKVHILDPDLTDETANQIICKWGSSFGSGEVSSAALAASRRWILVSQDLEPMRQFRLSITLQMETTMDILNSLVRKKHITKKQVTDIHNEILRASSKRRKRPPR